MIPEKIVRILYLSLLVCSAFILCAALGMLVNPTAFYKFFSPVQLIPDSALPFPHKSYYWDVRHYAHMVLSNQCTAFYPLWPLLVRFLFQPQNLEQAAHSLLKLSTVIFWISTPFIVGIFNKHLKHQHLSFLIVLAFTVNPMSIFRVIGYTEGLFTAFSLIFLWLFLQPNYFSKNLQLILIFVVILLLSLTRPILIQVLLASIGTLGTINVFENLKFQRPWNDFSILIRQYAQEIRITIALWISGWVGYSIYGFYCLNSRGNFFAPFFAQKSWSSKTGLHLELLLFPKSPLFDLLALYFPVIVLLVSWFFVYCQVKNKTPLVWVPQSPAWMALLLYPPLMVVVYIFNLIRLKKFSSNPNALVRLNTSDFTQTLSNHYIFWFCTYFSVVHCAMLFFTRDRLYSLGRHIFGIPFFFLALGYLCCCIPGKKTYQALWWFIAISAIALVEQWINYGHNSWLG
jgi:hypothetical protein